jgi:hypothetical protein
VSLDAAFVRDGGHAHYEDGKEPMSSTTRWWLAAPLAVGLVLAGCGGDDGDAADTDASVAPASSADAAPDPTASGGEDAAGAGEGAESSAGMMILGDEEIALGTLRCYFEEQPRAGLGGVFTHTAQGRGTDAEGVDVLLDLSRARADDGTIEDDIIVDIGDPTSDDAVSLKASGPEGLVDFGDASASADGVEVSDFGAEPVTLSFDLSCS